MESGFKMKFVFVIVINYLCLVKIIDTKKMRILPNDVFYAYTIDPNVKPLSEYMSIANLVYEQIDDDKVELGGYDIILKSVDPIIPLQIELSTKFFQNSIWFDAPFRLTLPSLCPELLNPSRFWYNMTKLWTKCPPKKGDRWEIEYQIIDVALNVPPTVSRGSWQAFLKVYQIGTIHNMGVMIQVDLIDVN